MINFKIFKLDKDNIIKINLINLLHLMENNLQKIIL